MNARVDSDRDSESRIVIAPVPVAPHGGAMPAILVTTRDGRNRRLEAPAGQPLMRALKGAGVDEILALCGGCASCGTCHVYVAEDWLPRLAPILADEDEVLSFSDWRQKNSRLSCQIPFSNQLDGIVITVAPED